VRRVKNSPPKSLSPLRVGGVGGVAAPTAAPIAVAQLAPLAPAYFVALQDVDPTILQEVRYFTPRNFTGGPVAGGGVR
jgi:D-alanyl-D-alanine dipeptidase